MLKLGTIDRFALRAIKPFEIHFSPFDTRIFQFFLHRIGQIEISGSNAKGVNVDCPLPIVAMKMSVTLTFDLGSDQAISIIFRDNRPRNRCFSPYIALFGYKKLNIVAQKVSFSTSLYLILIT
jgi:hypothetical protein